MEMIAARPQLDFGRFVTIAFLDCTGTQYCEGLSGSLRLPRCPDEVP